jgi:hypothetical protein
MTNTWRSFALAFAMAGCMTGPYNGTTASGIVAGKTFTFAGYYDEPNALVRVEILKDPTLDPGVDSNWALLAAALTGTNPLPVNNPDHPLYQWSVTAAPVHANPDNVTIKRWPQGGLARVRAVHVANNGQRRVLTTFDAVNNDCLGEAYAAGQPWDVIGTKCEGLGNNTAAIVSTSTNLPIQHQAFLSDKGIGNTTITRAYYNTIDAPANLAAFRTRFGFNSAPSSVVSARYFNDGDLGLGREMNCKSFFTFAGLGVACYVRNYSSQPFQAPNFEESAESVLIQTTIAQSPFATVAMVYWPNASENSVQFMVYDSSGNLTEEAPLDKAQDNVSIPQNCLSCHGVDSTFSQLEVSNKAEFLPFDPGAFKFSTQSPWRLSDQQDEFRKLNQLVMLTSPPPATLELINGMYAPKSINDSTAVANDTFIPSDWQPNATLDGQALYNGLIKPYCRTCHVSANDSKLDFADYADLFDTSSVDRAKQIRDVICATKKMPHAERVFNKFWKSGARAYVITGIEPSTLTYPDLNSACKP